MKQEDEDRVAFADVLLARRYVRELREKGSLSPDLQADVDRRGREHIEGLARIIELKDKA